MSEGHGRDEWARMSVLLALTGNAHRDPKKGRAFKPSDFDPFGSSERDPGEVIEINRENIGTLREAFLQQQGRKGF